jgi:predicted nucleic acid-binding Zn ribbon protein
MNDVTRGARPGPDGGPEPGAGAGTGGGPGAGLGGGPGLGPRHDPTGLDLASRIAHAARGGRIPARKRPRRDLEEAAWSGSGPSARDPQSAGALLDRVIAEKGWKQNLGVAGLLGHWADFVGAVNAQHTKPERFHDGVVTVRAESTTWAAAIRLLAPQIVAKLNAALGEGTVTAIRVLGPNVRSWKKGKRSVPGRGPRDTYG